MAGKPVETARAPGAGTSCCSLRKGERPAENRGSGEVYPSTETPEGNRRSLRLMHGLEYLPQERQDQGFRHESEPEERSCCDQSVEAESGGEVSRKKEWVFRSRSRRY